jgi:hypothetical protein
MVLHLSAAGALSVHAWYNSVNVYHLNLSVNHELAVLKVCFVLYRKNWPKTSRQNKARHWLTPKEMSYEDCVSNNAFNVTVICDVIFWWKIF